MSALDLLSGIGTGSLDALRGFQSLKDIAPEPSKAPDAVAKSRDRFAPSLDQIDARGLIDATRDVAANMFKAFRSEVKNALDHVGISGDAAAALVNDITASFANAVRDGANFSMTLVAAAYQETIVQAGNTVSHALEFAASALTVDYNHATGEFSADTSTLEIDAIKIVRGDGVQVPNALFDFTDTQGPGSLATIFDSVQQYLVENGFAEDPEAATEEALASDTDLNDTIRNSEVVDGADENAEDGIEDEPDSPVILSGDRDAPDFGTSSFNVRAVAQFTNAQQQEVTRLTIDLFVNFKFSGIPEHPARGPLELEQNRGIGLTV